MAISRASVDIFLLRGGGGLWTLSGATLGLELVLLGSGYVFRNEGRGKQLRELLLLGLDYLQRSFVALGLLLDDPGAPER